jgi:hypothetical protein
MWNLKLKSLVFYFDDMKTSLATANCAKHDIFTKNYINCLSQDRKRRIAVTETEWRLLV